MAVADILRAAAEAVEQAKVPEDLRTIAFGKAVDLLSGVGDAPVPSTNTAALGGSAPSAGGAAPSQRLQRIADALDVQGDRIEIVYTEHGDALQLVADPADLGSSMKERAKNVALLLAGGRQLGGWDEGATLDEIVRGEVDRLGVYDSTNYSKHVKELSVWFNVNGSGKKATYKLKFTGRQQLKELVGRLSTE